MVELVATAAFSAWLAGLADATARSRIAKRLARVELGLPGDAKSVGGGVSELRIDHGPGLSGLLHSSRAGRRDPPVRRQQGISGP